MPTKVTDPELLALLDAPDDAPAPSPRKVTDPALLRLLDGPEISKTESALRGGAQGLTFGFGDEMVGAYRALTNAPADWLFEKLNPGAERYPSAGEQYRKGRDEDRANNEAASLANPKSYLAGEVGGAVLPAVASFGMSAAPSAAGVASTALRVGGTRLLPRALGVAAGQGIATGVGYSNADTTQGLVGDGALGGALGVGSVGLGKLAGAGLRRARSWAVDKANQAVAKAAARAEKEIAEEIASQTGKYGSEVQKGSRYVENLMRLEPSMTAEQRAAYAQLEAAGIVPNLQQQVAGSTLDRLPGQASTILEQKSILDDLVRNKAQNIADRQAALLKPQPWKDTKSFLKAYAEPVVMSKLGGEVAGPTQAGALGMVFGRTRAGKALYDRITRPGHQYALANALRRTTEAALPSSNAALTARRAMAQAALTPLAAALVAHKEED